MSRNDHLSFSRLSRFETCPLSYRLHYLDKHKAEPGPALRFGKIIHAVLECLVREAVDQEQDGPLSEARALTLYREAWKAENLTGIELFQEGFELVQRFVRDQGVVEHRDVLAVEREFHLQVGPFTVLGYIDRVNYLDLETIEIVDYKTNRQLFNRDELDNNLQLSLYQLAAQQHWPWAKRIKLSYWMLRHGLKQDTQRTPEQLQAALAYVETLGRQTEEAKEFPPRLNTNCNFCDHVRQCPAYTEALKGKREFLCTDLNDLEAVAREREEVARLAKILYARKEELEKILKAQLQEQDELVLGGVQYRLFNATRLDYPFNATLERLAATTGRPREDLLAEVAVIDNKALEGLVKSLGKNDKNRSTLLKLELEAGAHKTYVPRFWAKEVPT